MLFRALETLFATAGDLIAEVIVVVDLEVPLTVLDALDPNVRVLTDDRPFNFSQRVNLGVAHATTPLVLLLNDDVECLEPGWLAAMVETLDEGAEVVGAVLNHADGTVQHVGHVYAARLPAHVLAGRKWTDAEVQEFCARNRECSGVTGACLLLRVETWDAVGGMSEEFPFSYNDADLCMKVRLRGGRCRMAMRARLVHHESVSRRSVLEADEVFRFWDRWWHLCTESFAPELADNITIELRGHVASAQRIEDGGQR
jgi:GT2 family glycosyltransferase